MSQTVQVKTLSPPTIQPLAPGATSPGNSALLNMNDSAATQTALVRNASGGKRMKTMRKKQSTKRRKTMTKTMTKRRRSVKRKHRSNSRKHVSAYKYTPLHISNVQRCKYKYAKWGGGIDAYVAPCGLGAAACATQQAASVANQSAYINSHAAATNDNLVQQPSTVVTKGGRRQK